MYGQGFLFLKTLGKQQKKYFSNGRVIKRAGHLGKKTFLDLNKKCVTPVKKKNIFLKMSYLYSMCILNFVVGKQSLCLKITGVSYKWYASVAGLPNLYSVIDG